jgi:hypothetical protein
VVSVEDDITLRCQAESEEILDVAYIWTHNGLRIRDTDLIHTRVVSFCDAISAFFKWLPPFFPSSFVWIDH